MANRNAIELVRVRNQFYRTNYRRMVKLVLLLLLIIAALVATICYMEITRPAPIYFATQRDGAIIQIIPLSQPYLNNQEVVDFATQAAVAAYSYDFKAFRQQLQTNVRPYFTGPAWTDFIKKLDESGTINAVRTRQLVVSATVLGKPAIIQEGLIDNQYAWKVQLPLRIILQNADESFQEILEVDMIIKRISTLVNPAGVGIVSFIAIPKQSNLPTS